MTESVDCLVIGAGVIGLAIGRALATSGREVLILERNERIGEETSSRNSEVIHAGLHYSPGSLKATLCVQGKAMLYAYCREKQIPHRRCGKLTVAVDDEQCGKLDALMAQARVNGVDDLVLLDAAEVRRREPALRCVGAFWSPSTGIVDSHALMLSLQADVESAAGILAFRTNVETLEVTDDAILVELGDDSGRLRATTVVNAAGHGALPLARTAGVGIGGLPDGYLAKGHYFSYRGASPFRTLIYPLPVDGGLGVHATLDLEGRLRFGPDTEWVDRIDYRVAADRRDAFVEAIRSYWPAVDAARLEPAYAGIRPKLSGPGEPPADFQIHLAAGDERRQLVHVLGIESPGLTASLALADAVSQRLQSVTG